MLSTPFPLGATLKENGVDFSLFSPFAKKIELLLFKNEKDHSPKIITFHPKKNKTYYYWHVFVPGIKAGQLYAYRVYGETDFKKKTFFDSSKILIDPYAKGIVGEYSRELAKIYGEDNLQDSLKSVVIEENTYKWQNYSSPKIKQNELIIYEMHVAGFTKAEKTKNAGTFSAIIDKIPYLKSVGINAIELMPIFAFDTQDAPDGKENYWGYSPINFFSIHPDYYMGKNPKDGIEEFKNLVNALHQNDIKIILDVVYNHTAEAHNDGPTYSFKGIAKNAYYSVNTSGDFRDFSGCGNSLNTNHSVVRRMIIDSLIYWSQEMKVDGFRFDLASVFSRDENGMPLENPPVVWDIDSHPMLSEAILIAEPWDATGLHQTKSFAGDKWFIWQDFFRDTLRKSVKGDKNSMKDFAHVFTGNIDNIGRHLEYLPHRNINFITAHDGFTARDLTTYNYKKNEENGENNRDGSNHNLSYNYGVEGETEDVDINRLRRKQVKNMMFSMLLSRGTPMILMGDEMYRTQKGNNNAYIQNNEISWLNWELLEKEKDLWDFVKATISIRKKSLLYQYEGMFSSLKNNTTPYHIYHGVELNKPDFSYNSHSIAIELVYPNKEDWYFIFNFYTEELEFQLPKLHWEIVLMTDNAYINEDNSKIKVPKNSVVLLQKKYKN